VFDIRDAIELDPYIQVVGPRRYGSHGYRNLLSAAVVRCEKRTLLVSPLQLPSAETQGDRQQRQAEQQQLEVQAPLKARLSVALGVGGHIWLNPALR